MYAIYTYIYRQQLWNKTGFLTQSVQEICPSLNLDSVWQVHNLTTVYLNKIEKKPVRSRAWLK